MNRRKRPLGTDRSTRGAFLFHLLSDDLTSLWTKPAFLSHQESTNRCACSTMRHRRHDGTDRPEERLKCLPLGSAVCPVH